MSLSVTNTLVHTRTHTRVNSRGSIADAEQIRLQTFLHSCTHLPLDQPRAEEFSRKRRGEGRESHRQ